MVSNKSSSSSSSSSESSKYRGVRKRNWGKWVAEIRLPNSRERIWLGSYDSAEKAARAFDAAQFCVRGRSAKYNLPNTPPDIPGGTSFSRAQIQSAAAEFANQLVATTDFDYACCQSQQTTTDQWSEGSSAVHELESDLMMDCSSSSVSDSLLFSDMFSSCNDTSSFFDLDVSVSDYGFYDDMSSLGFEDYGNVAAHESSLVQDTNYYYEMEEYPQLWNF
ncbi:hypothetical protein QQ045_005853 [Rhodiola kirilowii]